MNDTIRLMANDVVLIRERIAEFYRGHPEREEAAKRWWSEHTKERDEK